jgi:SAM-dependent methyltransferase
MRLQRRFERDLKYAPKTYAQASAEVYSNADYMQQAYLPGLLLSHYLWPHHFRQKLFFETAFVSFVRRAEIRNFCEVAVGTGTYSRILLQSHPEVRGVGFDVSDSALAASLSQATAFGVADRYRAERRDVVAHPHEAVSALVCVELLEHLENPVALLSSLRRMLAPGGKAFVTAALNAANADHIYLYHNPQEVAVHLQQAGFAIEQGFFANAYAPPVKDAPVPAVAAFVVTGAP